MTIRLFRGWLGHLLGWSLLAILGAVALVWWGWHSWTRPGPVHPENVESILVNIPQGMTLTAAADTLVGRGLLANRQVLLAGARITGQGRALRTGLYRLKYGSSANELLADLTSGRSVQVKVTIAEGLSASETADIMARQLDFSAKEFLAAADSIVVQAWSENNILGSPERLARYDSLLAEPPAPGIRVFFRCEGYLAPDTYHFGAGTGPIFAADHLIQTQLERLTTSFARLESIPDLVSSPHELLVLASIVEAEARRDDERARIAAVYTNRLAQRWRLEADPTVAFILEKKGKRLFYKDLEVDSPFNTYRHKGLPPGPLGSPGLLALQAAAQPEPGFKAMFFVSDGQGGHVFSNTSREHQEAVRRFRALKAAERRQK